MRGGSTADERFRACVALPTGRWVRSLLWGRGRVERFRDCLGTSFVRLGCSGFVSTGLAGWTVRSVFPPTFLWYPCRSRILQFWLRRSVCHYTCDPTWSTSTRQSTLVLAQLSLRAELGMGMSKMARKVAFTRLAIMGRAGRQDETLSQDETQV